MTTSVKVSIPSAFRRHSEGVEHFECPASDLTSLLDSLGSRFPELKPHLRDEQGNVRRFLNIYVNDEDIRFLGKDYAFKEGDEVTLVPSIAGG
jgi:molybdopterin converting factor small subunit